MEEIMGSVCSDFECELVEFNGESNHVHLMVNFPPKVSVSRLVNSLKGVSARRLRHRSSPNYDNTTGALTSSGLAHILLDLSVERQFRYYANTSNNRNDQIHN
jgi:REP element-mobilizing transposase RayT